MPPRYLLLLLFAVALFRGVNRGHAIAAAFTRFARALIDEAQSGRREQCVISVPAA